MSSLAPACRRLLLALAVLIAPLAAEAAGELRPFPQHQTYAPGSIKPSHLQQAKLDAVVGTLYKQWKAQFLRAGCTAGRYYVWHGGYGGGGTENTTISVSEGHGYGMVIAALMAGYDPDAKTIFDGLYAWYRDHPSGDSPDLMAWQQLTGCASSEDSDTATDGDLDIAYALLLADRQWGSAGAIDYLGQAKRAIAAIAAQEVNPQTGLIQPGNWVGLYDLKTYYSTRSSDWMPGHWRAFQAATSNAGWLRTLDATYQVAASLQTRYAPSTGLLPDFVTDTQKSAKPAPRNFLGEDTGDRYGWNACRDPWRLATDFLHYGEPRARTAVRRIEDYYLANTKGNPAKIRATRGLDGKVIENYSELAFTAPIAVGAMVDARYQAWLNKLWDSLAATPFDGEDYYGNTLRLLAMLTISGNWWKP